MLAILTCIIAQINSANSIVQIEKSVSNTKNGKFSQTPEKFIKAYNDGKFDSLSSLFQYPKDQNAITHKEDSIILHCLFSVMKEKWGPIINYEKIVVKNDSFAEISLNTADSSYWNKKKYLCTDTSYYRMSYQSGRKIISGFIQCDFEEIPKIGFYKFIVPYPSNATKEQMDEMNSRLAAVMQKMIELSMEKKTNTK